jgi:hypothetical protein
MTVSVVSASSLLENGAIRYDQKTGLKAPFLMASISTPPVQQVADSAVQF